MGNPFGGPPQAGGKPGFGGKPNPFGAKKPNPFAPKTAGSSDDGGPGFKPKKKSAEGRVPRSLTNAVEALINRHGVRRALLETRRLAEPLVIESGDLARPVVMFLNGAHP